MPNVYLSPSLKDYNILVSGGTEQAYANEVADAMEPYLMASGIAFSRSEPDMTLSEVIDEANRINPDVYLAIGMEQAIPALAAQERGVDSFYYVFNPYGSELAERITENVKTIYPLTEQVNAVPTATIREVAETKMPAVLVDLGYSDHPEDSAWAQSNIESIARELTRALAEYFDVPFAEPEDVQEKEAADAS